MSTSSYSATQILMYLFTSEALGPRPQNWFVSLHTGYPTPDGGDNEVSDSNYSRQPAAFLPQGGPGDIPEIANDADVTFPAAEAGYTVTHVCIFDSLTGGNALAILDLPLARSVSANGVFSIPNSELVISGATVGN